MPRKCANCEQIDANKEMHSEFRRPVPSDAPPDQPLAWQNGSHMWPICPTDRRRPTGATQGPATVVGVVLVFGVVAELEPGLTLSSGVRFWSNGRMIVLLFGEFTSCFSAWM